MSKPLKDVRLMLALKLLSTYHMHPIRPSVDHSQVTYFWSG